MAEMENSTPSSQTQEKNTSTPSQAPDFIAKVKSMIQKLKTSEKALAGGALLVIISSFLPAYGYATPYYQYSVNNLYSGIGWLNFLAAIVVLLLIVLPYFEVKIPTLPLPVSQILLISSIVAGICSLIQIYNYIFDGIPTAGNPSLGIFLVLAGSLLMAYTAYNDQKSHGPTQTPPTTNTTSIGQNS